MTLFTKRLFFFLLRSLNDNRSATLLLLLLCLIFDTTKIYQRCLLYTYVRILSYPNSTKIRNKLNTHMQKYH